MRTRLVACWRRVQNGRGEVGAVLAVWLIAAAVPITWGLAGYIYDGGNVREAQQMAYRTAEKAARLAADQLSTASLRSDGNVTVDAGAATTTDRYVYQPPAAAMSFADAVALLTTRGFTTIVGAVDMTHARTVNQIRQLASKSGIVFTDHAIDAAKAEAWGLVEEVVPVGQLDQAVERCVHAIVEAAPLAVRAQKRLMRRWERLSLDEAVQAGIDAMAQSVTTGEHEAIHGQLAHLDMGQELRAIGEHCTHHRGAFGGSRGTSER